PSSLGQPHPARRMLGSGPATARKSARSIKADRPGLLPASGWSHWEAQPAATNQRTSDLIANHPPRVHFKRSKSSPRHRNSPQKFALIHPGQVASSLMFYEKSNKLG